MSDLQDRSDNFAIITDKVTFLPKVCLIIMIIICSTYIYFVFDVVI